MGNVTLELCEHTSFKMNAHHGLLRQLDAEIMLLLSTFLNDEIKQYQKLSKKMTEIKQYEINSNS